MQKIKKHMSRQPNNEIPTSIKQMSAKSSNHSVNRIHTTDKHDPSLSEIFYDDINSPFGPATLLATQYGICGLGFCGELGIEATKQDFFRRWRKTQFIQSADNLTHYKDALFNDDLVTPLHLIGSSFYLNVWKALLDIPIGQTLTYSDVALRAGNARAVRAVGTAIGKNPISWLIPCHRAVRKDGTLGGYHWGLSIKRAMLAHEAIRSAKQ